jgi:hypothetical protein
MDARRSPSSTLRRVAVSAALAALLAPAGVAEAAKKKKVKLPVVTSVKPMEAAVGETITVYGRNFRRGLAKNSVVFKRDGARALFVKADVATTKQVKVVLPKKLEEFMLTKDGALIPTQFRVRVLSKRLGKSFTTLSKSPVLGPEKPPTPQAPPQAAADGDCDGDGVLNGTDTDDDNDLLTDAVETSIKTDGCKRDTDGDTAEDGYEYQSAIDLNQGASSLPYPHKLPYPNPLFADSELDYDGDGLWLIDEYKLWRDYGGRSLSDLLYSDGQQKSRDVASVGYAKQQEFLARAAGSGYSQEALLNFNGGFVHAFSGGADYDAWWSGGEDELMASDEVLTDVERYYYDQDLDGKLSDDERDEDGDGLGNWQEAHGFMTPEWWKHVYGKEKPFVNPYAGTSLVDWDTDGDGVVDGADDNDFDDLPNVREIRRQLVAGEIPAGEGDWCAGLNEDMELEPYVTFTMGADPFSVCWNRPGEATNGDPMSSGPWRAWVQPFNPCLPNPRSRTCEKYPNLGALYPPFDADTPVFKVHDGQFWNPE